MEMTFYASLLPSPKIELGLQELHDFVSPKLISRILSGRFGPNIHKQPPHFTIGEGILPQFKPTVLDKEIEHIADCFQPGLELCAYPEVTHTRNELILKPDERTNELLFLLNSILISKYKISKKPDQREFDPHSSLAFLDRSIDPKLANEVLQGREIVFPVMGLFVSIYKGNQSLLNKRYYTRSYNG